MKAGIYVRISLDQAGEGLGVERQETLCRTKATALGWDVAEVYVDNDVSASSAKERPAYTRLLTDLESGAIGAVVVYAIDRLTRKPMELETFIDLSERNGVSLANVAGDVDLSTVQGRLTARIMGSVARAEAENIGRRVKDQKAQRALKGIPHKGRHRLFGYDDDWTVIESEAAVVKEVFTRRANGESTTSIAKDLVARGVKTVAGNDWKSGTLSETLTKTVYAGKVSLKGEIVADSVYPALVDFAVFNAAQANLANDSKGSNARTYLLSGFLICGHCLTHMKGNPSNHMYRCAATYGGCGRLSVRIKIADDWALYMAVNKATESPSQPVTASRNYQVEIDAIGSDIERVKAMTREGAYTVPEGAAERKALQAKLNELVKEQAKALPRLTGPLKSYLDYHSMSLSQKRAWIGEYVTNIKVGPSVSRGNQPFDPSRFEFHMSDGEVIIPNKSMNLG